MNVFLWIVAGLLALAFLAAGSMKLLQPREKLISSGMGWAEDFAEPTVKVIGVLEVLGALALILPWALGVLPVLTPLAAVGLAVLMVAAMATHVRRQEWSALAPPVVLFVLAMVLAAGRFA